MKKTTKTIAAFALLAGLLGVTACGESTSSASSTSSDKVEVLFWHTMGKTNKDLVDREIEAFKKLYPNISITSTAATGSYDDLQSKILNAIPAGTTPTMAFCYPDNVAEYLDKDAVANLDSLISDSEVGFVESDGSHTDSAGKTVYGADDYVKAFWDEGNNYVTSGTYSVPFAKSTEALFYNKTVFDANGWSVPTTWDQMWDLCRTIRAAYPDKDADGNYSYYPLGYDSDSNLYITLSQQKGIPYTSKTGDHYLFNNAQAKAMATDLKSKYDEGLFVTKGTSANATYTSTKFTAGEIFMSIGSTGGTTYNQTDNFTVGVAVPPSEDLNAPAVISQGPSICFFKSASKAQLRAAWLFYRFISTTDASNYYGISTGYQPVRTSSFESATYQKFINATGSSRTVFNDVASVTATMNNSYFNSPVFVGSAKARTEVGSMLASILLGSKTVDKAFTDAMTNCLVG
ncbi:MAG: sn-glycerol-3-phosphate-binding periplasmic protein UgpB precursor [Tenericutes bacterium ADurb.BinA155]|nr:MAG: sn-glycerol-3-phosphate-binding periplasmic protein UgpB precursor [Tenericutes bacterium ADurb.BinA155]